MIRLDAGLLIQWELESALSGSETVGFTWVVLLAFLRLSTKRGVFDRPLGIGNAFEIVSIWLAQTPSMIVQAGPKHFDLLRELLTPLGTGGNLSSDAHLAAIARELGAEVVTFDADFGRFSGVKWRNPLG